MVVSGKEIVCQWAPCVGKLADEAKWHREILTIMGKWGIELSIKVTRMGKRSGVQMCPWARSMSGKFAGEARRHCVILTTLRRRGVGIRIEVTK